jgi:HEAT repeat protein
VGEVVQAAELTRVLRYGELAPELIEAYERLAVNPVKLDPSCAAMEAIVRALDAFEEPARGVYSHAVRHVQMSPLFDDEMEQIDLAAGLRRQAILAMVRTGDPDALVAATDLLADPKTVARAGAANALRVIGSEAAVLLLRFRVKSGERKPDVLAECFAGLMEYSSGNLDVVAACALGDDEQVASLAALAIADARPSGAFEVLKQAWETHRNPQLREILLNAIAGLRTDEAVEFLIELVGRDSVTAIDAMTSLSLYAADRGVVARIEAEAKANRRPEVHATFRRMFQ